VKAAPANARGFDANTVLTQSTAKAFAQAGFSFAVRYLPRNFVVTPGSSQGNLTNAEAQTILGAGLALMAVQHVAASPWTPSAALGQSYGHYAVLNAQAVGLPRGVNIWLDLEGVASGVTAETVMEYCNAWFDQVSAAGYAPGVYVGANSGLSSQNLQALLFAYFWESGSTVPSIPGGYCMKQSISSSYVLNGVAYDLDSVTPDYAGRTPQWLQPASNP
jgi:hypothetical protein